MKKNSVKMPRFVYMTKFNGAKINVVDIIKKVFSQKKEFEEFKTGYSERCLQDYKKENQKLFMELQKVFDNAKAQRVFEHIFHKLLHPVFYHCYMQGGMSGHTVDDCTFNQAMAVISNKDFQGFITTNYVAASYYYND